MKYAWILLAIFAMSALAAACGDSKPSATATATSSSTRSSATPTVATPLASATDSPTSDNAPPALYPAGYRSGVANVDGLMAILEKADGAALAQKVQLLDLACTNQHAGGTSGPPPCEDTEAEGTIVHVFMTGACEPNYQREPQASAAVRNFGSQHPYRLAFAYTGPGPAQPGSVYVDIGTGASEGYATVILNPAGGLIGITNCGGHISVPSPGDATFVVPPA